MYIRRPGKDLRVIVATWRRPNRNNDGISRHLKKEADHGGRRGLVYKKNSIWALSEQHLSHIRAADRHGVVGPTAPEVSDFVSGDSPEPAAESVARPAVLEPLGSSGHKAEHFLCHVGRKEKTHFIETTYVDDFSRASRDEVEWWKLAHSLPSAVQANGRSVRRIRPLESELGHDDFDVRSALAVVHQGLREKVRRGMRGAARRGTCIGKLPLGFTRCVHRDDNGNIACDKDGVTLHRSGDQRMAQERNALFKIFKKCLLVFTCQIVSSLHATGDDQSFLRFDQLGQLLQSGRDERSFSADREPIRPPA